MHLQQIAFLATPASQSMAACPERGHFALLGASPRTNQRPPTSPLATGGVRGQPGAVLGTHNGGWEWLASALEKAPARCV